MYSPQPAQFFFRRGELDVFWLQWMQSQWRIGDCPSSFDRQSIEAAVEAHGCLSYAPVPHHGPKQCSKSASNSNRVSQMMQASLAVDRRTTIDKRHVLYTHAARYVSHANTLSFFTSFLFCITQLCPVISFLPPRSSLWSAEEMSYVAQ